MAPCFHFTTQCSTCDKQNVRMVFHEDSVWYVATKTIEAGHEILVSYGRDYFKTESSMAHMASFECGMLPLILAAARGDRAAVRRILSESGSVDMATMSSDDGWTAVIEASWGGYRAHTHLTSPPAS